MVRVLRYPRLCALTGVCALSCALCRDFCVGAGYSGWARVLLYATLALLGLCLALMSCRFLVDERGVGVGFLLRVRSASWEELASVGMLCCNSKRMYLYGLYSARADFLTMLHHAPACGPWGFVVPLSKKLVSAVQTHCPYEVDLSPVRFPKKKKRLRPLWHQAALYLLALLPVSGVAFATGALMLMRAAEKTSFLPSLGLTAGAFAFAFAGALLARRTMIAVFTCPRISEEGVSAGGGLYLTWNDVRFGFVRRMAQASGLFLLSQKLDALGKRGAPPVLCLSMPDMSTLVLAYLTYCPNAEKGQDV
ncbi:MAG: hypothetical protein Q4G52_12810 [Clostridia bacterium]|nr:hypothetical protein [Clostridia bacterium]